MLQITTHTHTHTHAYTHTLTHSTSIINQHRLITAGYSQIHSGTTYNVKTDTMQFSNSRFDTSLQNTPISMQHERIPVFVTDTFLQPTGSLEAAWCYRGDLRPLIKSSEDTIHTLTFSFPSFPPLPPSVSPPHTFTLPQPLINSPVLSRCLNLSPSLSHILRLVLFFFSRSLLIPTSLLKHTHIFLTLSSFMPFLTCFFFHFFFFRFCPISVPHCGPSTHNVTDTMVVVLTTFCLKWPLKNKRLKLSIQSLSLSVCPSVGPI